MTDARVRLAIVLTAAAIVLPMSAATMVTSIHTGQAATDLKRDAQSFRAEQQREAACGQPGRHLVIDEQGMHITRPNCPDPMTTTVRR